MPNRKQHGHMWGCLVKYVPREEGFLEYDEEWMWEYTSKYCTFPLVFTLKRTDIMPLVEHMRSRPYVLSAKAVKVPIPEIP